jgi:VWFA-related protein
LSLRYDDRIVVRTTLLGFVYLLAGIGSPAYAQPPQVAPPRITERVDVSRVVVDVHVLADDGSAVLGLRSSDFRVFVDGRPVTLDEVRWTSESVASHELRAEAGAGTRLDDSRLGLPSGRQIVLLVQRDLDASRFQGLVTMLRRAVAFIDGLQPDDRVAVVSFQSHLDLWTDYTTNRDVLRQLVDRRILTESPPVDVPPGEGQSLSLYFDRTEGRRASSMEEALLVLARALDKLPGEKSVVLFGFGFGRMLGSRLAFDAEYGEARRLLMKARAAVFCLDVTDAASHTLEAGLVQVAADTGGFYVRTNDWPGLAMQRLGRALTGRYEVAFVRPDLPRGEHAIRIELMGRPGHVLARRAYTD